MIDDQGIPPKQAFLNAFKDEYNLKLGPSAPDRKDNLPALAHWLKQRFSNNPKARQYFAEFVRLERDFILGVLKEAYKLVTEQAEDIKYHFVQGDQARSEAKFEEVKGMITGYMLQYYPNFVMQGLMGHQATLSQPQPVEAPLVLEDRTVSEETVSSEPRTQSETTAADQAALPLADFQGALGRAVSKQLEEKAAEEVLRSERQTHPTVKGLELNPVDFLTIFIDIKSKDKLIELMGGDEAAAKTAIEALLRLAIEGQDRLAKSLKDRCVADNIREIAIQFGIVTVEEVDARLAAAQQRHEAAVSEARGVGAAPYDFMDSDESSTSSSSSSEDPAAEARYREALRQEQERMGYSSRSPAPHVGEALPASYEDLFAPPAGALALAGTKEHRFDVSEASAEDVDPLVADFQQAFAQNTQNLIIAYLDSLQAAHTPQAAQKVWETFWNLLRAEPHSSKHHTELLRDKADLSGHRIGEQAVNERTAKLCRLAQLTAIHLYAKMEQDPTVHFTYDEKTVLFIKQSLSNTDRMGEMGKVERKYLKTIQDNNDNVRGKPFTNTLTDMKKTAEKCLEHVCKKTGISVANTYFNFDEQTYNSGHQVSSDSQFLQAFFTNQS